MGTQIFFLTHARDKTKNIFLYFFIELKTYHFFLFDLLISYLFYFYSYWDKSKSDRSFLKNDGDGSN